MSVAVRTLKTIPGDLKGGESLNQENPFHMPSDSSNPFGVPGSFRRPNENGGNAHKPVNDQNRASNSDKPTPPEEQESNRDHRGHNDHSDRTSPEEQESNPFIVPGHERSESKSTIGGSQTRIKHPTGDATGVKEGSIDQPNRTDGPQEQPTRTASPSRQGDVHHTPFVWGVPNKPTKAEQEADLGNESPQPSVKSPASSDHESSDKSQNAGVDPRLGVWQTAASGVSIRRRKGNMSGVDYSGLLDGIEDPTEDGDDDDPFGINGFNEEWSPTPDDDPSLGVFDDSGVDGEDSGDDGNDDDPFGINGTHGGNVSSTLNQHNVKLEHDRSRINMDALTARSHVDVSDGGSYAVESSKLREGVQIGTVKRELGDFIHNPKIVDKAIARKIQLLEYKKKMRIPFTPKIPKILDFLTRWRIGTTLQLARIAGWKDSNEQRLVKKLRVYDEVGFMRETDIYAGPKIWTAQEHGAELGFHPWLGGVRSSEINPMSQSHTFGLSSIASWLLCPGDNAPNILGLAPDEWNQVRGEIKDGTAILLAEKEYRSSYSSIRNKSKGLLPSEYRHGFIGYAGGQLNPVHGAWQEWALAYKSGDATLDESPELLACDPEFMGANLWMWIIWGNSVWNPKVLEDRAVLEEGIDLDDPEWSGRDGELRLRSEFRHLGYVDIEERLDIASNKPMINKELGDRFALWDHLPDMIIARRRTDDEYADPQSIAIELELSAKSTILDYSRTMAAYGSPLGQTLFAKVIWLVSSKTIADRIRAGANKVGMVLGEDYDIVPFVTSNKASVIKKSFYTGADILPGKWSRRGIIEPCEFDRSIPLS